MSKTAWATYLVLAASVVAVGRSAPARTPPAHGTPAAGTPATTRPTTQPLRLTDVDGVPREPLDLKDATAAVFLFIATDCPISNSYAPEINRICAKYGDDRSGAIRFYLVYPDADLRPAAAKAHMKDFGYTCPA